MKYVLNNKERNFLFFCTISIMCEIPSYSTLTDKNICFFRTENLLHHMVWGCWLFQGYTKLNAWLLGKDGCCALPLSCFCHLKFGIRNWEDLKFNSAWVKNIFRVPWGVNHSLNSWIAKQILYKRVIHMLLRTNFIIKVCNGIYRALI